MLRFSVPLAKEFSILLSDRPRTRIGRPSPTIEQCHTYYLKIDELRANEIIKSNQSHLIFVLKNCFSVSFSSLRRYHQTSFYNWTHFVHFPLQQCQNGCLRKRRKYYGSNEFSRIKEKSAGNQKLHHSHLNRHLKSHCHRSPRMEKAHH